jgi:uncharacterized protein (DUF1778 family)
VKLQHASHVSVTGGAIIGARQLYKLYRLDRQRQSRCEDRVLAGVDLYAYQAHNKYMATKTERLAARLTPEQDALIRRAAEVEGTDLTNFTVTAALAHAREVLADRRLFVLTDAAWTEFLAALDRPVSHKPRLEKLFAERSVFDTEV